MYRPEYPRPSFVRENWINLNGIWDFEIGNDNVFDKVIEVPFCPESALSGIGHKDFMYDLQYRKTVEITVDKMLQYPCFFASPNTFPTSAVPIPFP